jgi:TP901 family phage tail tape measure protein
MADIVNQAQTRVSVDGQQAENELKTLEQLAKKYRDAMLAASKAGDTKAYERARKQLAGVDKDMRNIIRSSFDVNKVLNNLSSAGPKDLRKALAQLNKELNSGKVARGSKEWEELQRKIRAVREEINKINSEQSLSRSPWERMTDGFNKYFGLATTFLASITGLSFAFRKLAEDVAKMDDTYADVMKTTGMTRDEVVDLNNEFKKMDTRTAREELNNLARDAGKLGLTSKKDILDFVEAGNQINVSLGEDLGEGAIKNIGKLTDVFALSTKELANLDLKEKMLAIGSAVNELGASSNAAEGYMVNFAQRLGGVAAQAGISIQDVLGYASALDQSGQAVEMSATAMQKFIMSLMSDPAKFAKIAGLEVNKFNKLLKEDTNAAIKEVLTSLSQKGGFQALIPIFKEMGLDGARAVGVLSALATNIEKVNEAQEVSNRAFSEGVSITNEYDTKNNNLQATLEKQRKAFKDAALELGERLNPVLLKSTNFMTYLIKVAPSVIDWFVKYKGVIVTLATAYVTYNAVINYSIAIKKLQVFWNTKILQSTILLTAKETLYKIATEASTFATYAKGLAHDVLRKKITLSYAANELLRISFAKTPWGLVITLATTAAMAIYQYSKRTKEATTATTLLSEAQNEAQKSISGERAELDLLISVAKNDKISKDERLKAIKKLNEISPEYLANLNLENINTQEATKSIKLYTEALIKNAEAKAIQGRVQAEMDKKTINNYEIEQEQKFIKKKQEELKGYTDESAIYVVEEIDNSRKRIKQYQEENAQIDENISVYTSFYEKTFETQKQAAQQTLFTRKQELESSKAMLGDLEQKYADTYNRIQNNRKSVFAENLPDAKYDPELALLNKQIETQRQLVQEKNKGIVIDEKTLEFQRMSEKQLKSYIVAGKEYSNIASDILKKKFPEDLDLPTPDPKGTNKVLDEQKKALSLLLEQEEIEHQNRLLEIKEKYKNGIIKTESDFNTQIFSQEQTHYGARLAILMNFKEEIKEKIKDATFLSDIDKQIADLQNKSIDKQIQFREKIEKIILDANPEAKEKVEYENRLRDLDLFGVDRQKLTEEQYEALSILEKQHNDNLVKIRKDARNKQRSEANEKFQEDFKTRKEELASELAAKEQEVSFQNGIGALNPQEAFNAEIELQQMRLYMIQQELEARQRAGLEVSRIQEEQRSEELALTNLYVQEFNRRAQLYTQYGKNVGAVLGEIITGQENALKVFGNTMLDILFDTLTAMINAEIIKMTAVGTSAIARSTAESLTTPDSILTFGASGLARAAVLTAIITGAMEAAKGTLKGLMGNYWTGGYTPIGGKYDIAGYVHKGEFVGNQQAVANPEIRRVFDVINLAQQNNTVSSLKASDFATKMEYKEKVAYPSSQPVTHTSNPVNQSNDELIAVLMNLNETQNLLKQRLDKPIKSIVSVTGKDGIKENLDKYERMTKESSRK